MKQLRRRISKYDLLADGEREGSEGSDQRAMPLQVTARGERLGADSPLEMPGVGCSRLPKGVVSGRWPCGPGAAGSRGSTSAEVGGKWV